MRTRAIRRLRWALLAVLAAVLLAVAWTLRRPAPAPPAAAGGSAPSATSFGALVYRSFKEGKESFVVKAKGMVGERGEQGPGAGEGMRLQGVEVTFPYVSRGEPARTVVTSDECLYDPIRTRAAFRGHVRVVTGEGLEVTTESLVYQGDLGVVKSEEHAAFRRRGVSGSATGMSYEASVGTVVLSADVAIRIEHEGTDATEVHSDRARFERGESRLEFEGGVEVTRGHDRLQAGRLTLELSSDLQSVDRAVAKGDVEVRTSGATLLPGTAAPARSRGERRLSCRRLEMWFHPNGALDLATAAAGHDEQGLALWAELEVLPGPGARPEKRRMQSRVFRFRFDEEGRLRQLYGQDGVVAVLEPAKPGAAAPRSLRCLQLVAGMDPASGELETAQFAGEVELAEGGRKATAQSATYTEAKSALLLTGSPRIVDEEQGSDLRADTIEVGVRSGDVAAQENVRHKLTGRGRPGLVGESEPVLLLARFLDYQSAGRKGRYRENALLRSGRDEIRAPLLVLEEPAPGKRRLRASGGVASLLHPRTKGTQKRGAAPVEARAQEMDYEEARSLVVYRGDVAIRQADIQTRSPEATLTLTPDGSALEKLVAGEPVEVQQGERRANGTRATYTPEDETMVLVGEKAVLKDPRHQVQGRSLTFHAGDDRILVDGREEVRTEAIFRKEPPRR